MEPVVKRMDPSELKEGLFAIYSNEIISITSVVLDGKNKIPLHVMVTNPVACESYLCSIQSLVENGVICRGYVDWHDSKTNSYKLFRLVWKVRPEIMLAMFPEERKGEPVAYVDSPNYDPKFRHAKVGVYSGNFEYVPKGVVDLKVNPLCDISTSSDDRVEKITEDRIAVHNMDNLIIGNRPVSQLLKAWRVPAHEVGKILGLEFELDTHMS